MVCLGILVVAPVILWRRKGTVSVPFLALAGVGGSLGAFLVYTLRFLAKSPKRFELSDHGLKIERRTGPATEFAWGDVTEASFQSNYGLAWNFKTAAGWVRLRGDGFGGMDWYRISRAIADRLAEEKIDVSTDGVGGNFLS